MAGQLIDKGNDKYLVRVFLGRDANGKRKYHSKTIQGKRKAQKYLNDLLYKVNNGEFKKESKMSVDQYLDQWMETAASQKLRTRTYKIYDDYLRLYIRPNIGSKYIEKLTTLQLQKMFNQFKEKELSPGTIKKIHTVLSSALNQAVKWGVIPSNPLKNVDLPTMSKKEVRVLSPDESKKFLEAAKGDRFELLFLLMLTTGVRPGEALGLRWSDIKGGKIQIQKSLTRKHGGGWVLTDPKTKKSRRSIPLPDKVANALKTHKKEQLQVRLLLGDEYTNHDFVFASENGSPMNERNIVLRHFKPILKKAGLPEDIRLYDLRHTCATLLLSAGENPKVVSERLGHASVVTTLDTYSHVLPDMQKSATEKIESMLF